LGGGGFGLTFLAQDLSLNRKLVIKTPNRQLQRDQNYDKFVRRFRREGEALAKISHPNVVTVIELFYEDQTPCLVMAYIEGETLNDCIRNHGALTQEEAVEQFRKLALALQRLHAAGVIHCDVHPWNIILRQEDREPILIDFGSAKILQPNTYTVTTAANESYAPYEQRRQGVEPHPNWDVYGLAATLYFAVTGHKPQPSIDRKLYGYELIAPQQHRSDLSSWLNQAILQGMALEPENRIASMPSLLGALHPPQPSPRRIKTPKPDQAQPKRQSKDRPLEESQPKVAPKETSKPKFPFTALGFLILGLSLQGFSWD
jgi:serine/threonine-protein kinase